MATRRKRKNVGSTGDPTRWAHAAFVLGCFALAWVLTNFVEDAWAIVWSRWPQVGRPNPVIANASGIAIALIATIFAWRHRPWFKFVTEVAVEVSQVTWPTKAETRSATMVVVVITLICSAILATMDQLWSTVTGWLYGI